ncbi:MAG: exosortase system-associated protein, TIGR04073 family [Candidatus Omnitrophica bacterium]|nr:exosortase system-associated protein, TIGR04073 family [Candidatus Omnitrophota bacterium]
MRKGIIVIVVLLMVFMLASSSYAQDPGKKLMRGLANILTGWVELPKNIYETSVEDNVFSGLTIGLAKGIGMTIVRTGAGIYETVTFPFPIPEDYAPVLEPEYVFGGEAAGTTPEPAKK